MTVHNGYEAGFDVCLDYGKHGERCVDLQLAHLFECRECEVKNDVRALDTGRVYVEYEMRGRDGKWYPSGIQSTKGQLWAFAFGDTGFTLIVPTLALHYIARQVGRDRSRQSEHKTGENPTKGVTVSIKDMLHWASTLPFKFDPNELTFPVAEPTS